MPTDPSTSVPFTPVLLEKWEAAAYLGMTEDGFARLIRDGVVPVVKIGGKAKGRVRIRRVDLDDLIAASLHPATAGPLAK